MESPDRGLSPQEVERWTRIGLLSALGMALGYLETFIPLPIPGVKLGLANIAVLIALAEHDVAGAFCIGAIKVLAAGLLFGNPLTMTYSAAGTLASLLIMAPLSRLRSLHIVMLSVVGALAHEMGQLAVANVLLGSAAVWYSAPVLLVAGCLSGLLCGMIAARTMEFLGGDVPASAAATPAGQAPARNSHGHGGVGYPEAASAGTPWPGQTRLPPPRRHVNAKAGMAVFAIFCIVALHASSPIVLGACVAAGILACLAGHVQLQVVRKTIRPLALILAITFFAQVATMQQGTVLVSLGPVAITYQALAQGAVMAARLLSITLASIAVMYLAGPRELARAVAWAMGPLRRMGIRTEGFALALQVALQTVPVLAQSASSHRDEWKSQVGRGDFWRTTIPRYIADAYRDAGRA